MTQTQQLAARNASTCLDGMVFPPGSATLFAVSPQNQTMVQRKTDISATLKCNFVDLSA
jgi:hypothetical protein